MRWATDATYVWTRFDGLVYVNAVLDCADRECIGLNVSQRNDTREAAWALEDALIRRFGALPRGNAHVVLRTTTRSCKLLSCIVISPSPMVCTKSLSCRMRPSRTASRSRSWERSSSSASGNIDSKPTTKRRDHGLGYALQRVATAFAARLPPAGGMAQPAGRIKRLICPETAGSLQSFGVPSVTTVTPCS